MELRRETKYFKFHSLEYCLEHFYEDYDGDFLPRNRHSANQGIIMRNEVEIIILFNNYTSYIGEWMGNIICYETHPEYFI